MASGTCGWFDYFGFLRADRERCFFVVGTFAFARRIRRSLRSVITSIVCMRPGRLASKTFRTFRPLYFSLRRLAGGSSGSPNVSTSSSKSFSASCLQALSDEDRFAIVSPRLLRLPGKRHFATRNPAMKTQGAINHFFVGSDARLATK